MAEGVIARRGGSGAGLNFKIVGGTTRPTHNLVENTIWINTEHEITGWVFNGTEPLQPSEGMVWIKTKDNSHVAFNAIKRTDMLVVAPDKAFQYIDSTWCRIYDVEIYQYRLWRNFLYGVLFDQGVITDQCEHTIYTSPTSCTVTFSETGITCATTGGKASEACAVFGQVYLKPGNEIEAHALIPSSNPNGKINAVLYIAKDVDVSYANADAISSWVIESFDKVSTGGFVVLTVPEGAEGLYYIYCGTHTDGSAWNNKRTVTFPTLKIHFRGVYDPIV